MAINQKKSRSVSALNNSTVFFQPKGKARVMTEDLREYGKLVNASTESAPTHTRSQCLTLVQMTELSSVC